MLQTSSGNKGVSIIEMLVVIAILAITLTTLLGLVSFSLGIQGMVRQTTQASNLAQEAMEAVRSIRDNSGWAQMVNGNHGLANAGGHWIFSDTDNVISGFTRTVLISDVQRDVLSNIVESGGVVDADTKKITITVSWSERSRPHDIELITYLTNWKR